MSIAITVPFHGSSLFVIEQNGQPYTPMKPIVEGMGLAWQSQHRKLAENPERWGITMMVIPTLGALQEAICMPLRKLAGWLMTIQPSRVKPQIRDTILKYQNECDDVLWQYWTEGQVIRPRNAEETLLPSEQQTLSEIVHKRAKVYGELQGKVLAEIWSRVHRKFRVSRYSQLRRIQFSEAILYVTGLEIRGGKPLLQIKTYHYPRKLLEQPHFTTPKIPASLGISMLANTKEFVSPLFALLNELRADGHDISSPWDEAVAMREAIQRADKTMEKTISLMWASRFGHASTAGNT